ncbi:C25 family cysteine peptidase [Chloroflexota bacterium]
MNNNKYFSKTILAISTILLVVMSIFVTPSSASANGGGTYDYVIITTNDIVANSEYLDFFIKMKENEGHTVKIVTEDDFGSLTGQDPNDKADKIRKWLKDNYVSLGIEYVLLIGDPNPDDTKNPSDFVGDIPMKMCWPRYFRVGDGAPTDLYYSDLTSNWDLDGDGFYHESLDYNNPTSPNPSPNPNSINEEYFSVEWSGYVQIDHAQTNYDFRVLSDDGIRITIGGSIVDLNALNKEGLSYRYVYSDPVDNAGRIPIKLQFWEKTGDAVCQLYWKNDADGDNYKIIPSDKLYTADSDSASGGLNAKYYNNEKEDDPEGDWWLDTPVYTRIDPTVDFIWGTGDIGPSDPDYTPEVFVGRIPVYDNDYEQLDKILRKIINYETDPGDISWRNSILLPMVETSPTTFGGGLGEAIMTDAAIPSGSSYYRIYEQEDAGFTPEAIGPTIQKVRDEWINGYGMVTWYTHGWEEGASDVMDTANVGALDDTKPSFTMQPSCHNAFPENPNNLAYSLLKNGAIATIASTRMTTFQFGSFASFNPVEYFSHQVSYYYTRYVMRDNMPAGVAYSEVVKYHKAPNANAIEYNLYGDPECQLFTVTPNEFPTADANGPYTGDEGSPIYFDAVGSVDFEAMPMEYRWDFDGDDTWDTDWSTIPTAEYTWGDDYSGTVKLEVRDEIGKTDITTTTVTIQNVAPTAAFDTLGQPNPQFILPYQELTFTGAFTDPGWEDTHTATWDFGDDDTTVIAGDVTEENDEPDSTGTITGEHSYEAPGTYTVTLTAKDDEDDIDTDTTTVVVVTALEALQDLDDYIQNTVNEDYKYKANARKIAFSNKFKAIYKILDTENYLGLIKILNEDIREKCDGLIDGNPENDWIIDSDTQYHICMKVDDISDYIDYLLNN